jgi:hypothetical protein
MSQALIQPYELRTRGFEVLVHSLGWVNAVRFIQQYEPGAHDYTAERDQILPTWEPAEMVRQLKTIDRPGSK